MLFNSYIFLFVFLPVVLAVFFFLGRLKYTAMAIAWLVLASLFFYGWWNPPYLLLLGCSILFNFFVGNRLASLHPSGRGLTLLIIGITANLMAIGYFKYANFFVDTLNVATELNIHLSPIILPLAISFFTFQQITFLVDAYRGETREYSFLHYVLFVSFFPQLIAGPIVHHKEMLPQFRENKTFYPNMENFAVGLTIFFIGLIKKTVLADGIAVYASPVFATAETGVSIDFFIAWSGALAYCFQLYFDFSGYSDMAIGGARMFGIKLPLNFNSPYKALNIIDFWRRWHITLSRFLRDYLYFSLGGNRNGRVRRYINLLITMLLGGLWHGAGWTFVAWGGLHGLYLVVNHAWRRLIPISFAQSATYKGIAWFITFLAVLVGWVFFRAESFDGAMTILEGMAGINGVSIPAGIIVRLGEIGSSLQALGVEATAGGGAELVAGYVWISVLLLISILAPNTQEIMSHYAPALGAPPVRAGLIRWAPNRRWAFATAAMAAGGILTLSQVSEFLYFQF